MSLFTDTRDSDSHGRNLADLLLIGGVQLETLAQDEGRERVTFKAWAAAVEDATRQRRLAREPGQLKWLWKTLTTEPRVRREIGARVVSLEEEWANRDPVLVLKAGAMLGVFLKPFRALGAPILPLPGHANPEGLITLQGDLWMEPGKSTARRFECCDVECEVEIRVESPGTAEQEALLRKLEPEDVTVRSGRVYAHARSLNHAYTVVSRRLQPHRRSHGGRSYDHLVWCKSNEWITLESIRIDVEDEKWSPG